MEYIIELFKVTISMSLMGSVVAAIILLIRIIFKNKFSATWHYYLWILLLIRLVMPFTPESAWSVFNLLPDNNQNVDQSVQENDSKSNTNIVVSPPNEFNPIDKKSTIPNPEPAQINTIVTVDEIGPSHNVFRLNYETVSMVWALGVVIIMLYIIAINLRLHRKIRKQPRYIDDNVSNVLEECKAKINIKSNIPVVCDMHVKTPSLFGFIKPKLLVSSSMMKKLTKEEIRYVFLHELSHFKRKDILVNFLATLVQALHWFNPLVWYSLHKMQEDQEVACDAYVLAHLHQSEHRKYGKTIINVIQTLSKPYWNPLNAGMASKKSNIRRRISMISMFKKPTWKWSLLAFLLFIILGSVVLTNAIDPMKKSKFYQYIEQSTDYPVLSATNKEGHVLIDLQTLDQAHWLRKDFIQHESRLLLGYVKHFPLENIKEFQSVTLHFITKKTEREVATIQVYGDTLLTNDWWEIENFKAPKYVDYYSHTPLAGIKDDEQKQQLEKELSEIVIGTDINGKRIKHGGEDDWQIVSRGYRVQGSIENVEIISSELRSLTINVEENLPLENSPADYDFKGQKLRLAFDNEKVKTTLKDKLKSGTNVVITFGQFSIPPDGKVVLGSTLDSEWVLYEENGDYYNSRGDYFGPSLSVTEIEESDNKTPNGVSSSATEIFPLSEHLLSVYQEFSKTKTNEALNGLEPIDIVQLYYYTEFKAKDYETLYYLHVQDQEKYMIPPKDKFIEETKSNIGARKKFLNELQNDLIRLQQIYNNGNEARIEHSFKGEIRSKVFQLAKEDGIWKALWLPLQ